MRQDASGRPEQHRSTPQFARDGGVTVLGHAERDARVLVAGGGIGGLATAAFLRRGGLDPVVVDRSDRVAEVPGTVELWPEAVRLLDYLGVGNGVREDGNTVTVWRRRRPDGTVTRELEAGDGPGFVAVDHARLRERLLDAVPDERVPALEVNSIAETGECVSVGFVNGVREQFDAVVGADGVHSTARAAVGGDDPEFCGTKSVAFPLGSGVELEGASEVWTADDAAFRAVQAGDRATGWLTVLTDVPSRNLDGEPVFEKLRPDIGWLLPETVDGRRARWFDDFRAPADRRAERLGLEYAPGESVTFVVVDDGKQGVERVRFGFEEPATYDADHYATALVRAAESVLSPAGWRERRIRSYLADRTDATLAAYT